MIQVYVVTEQVEGEPAGPVGLFLDREEALQAAQERATARDLDLHLASGPAGVVAVSAPGPTRITVFFGELKD